MLVVRLVAVALEYLETVGTPFMSAVVACIFFSLKDFFKSFMPGELAKGMVLTGRYLPSPVAGHGSVPEERRLCRRAFVVFTRCAVTTTAKSVASPANSVRPCVRRWPSLSSPMCADGTRRTTRYDIDPTKVHFCGFAKKAARWIDRENADS